MRAGSPGFPGESLDRAALAVGSLLLFLPGLGSRDLWNPNEPIYGRAVVEMVERSAWLLPTVNGELFAEKPILFYWLARVVSSLFGYVDEWTLRLPSALTATLGVLLVHALVRSRAGRQRALLAAGVFATTSSVFWAARTVQMDMLLTVACLATVVAALRAFDSGSGSNLAAASAGVFAGIGFLAKGPLGLVLPALVIGAFLPGRVRLDRRTWRRLAIASAACIAVVLPWLVALMAYGEWAALHELFARQNVSRFLDAWDHREPWWYYLLYFWIDMAPWSFFLPLALTFRKVDREPGLRRLTWSWIALPLLFFSLASSKRSAYLLPVAPAVAIGVSGFLESWLDRGLGAVRSRLAAGIVATIGAGFLVVAPALTWIVAPRYPGLRATSAITALFLLAGGAALLVVGALGRRRPRALLATLGVSLVGLYLLLAVRVLPELDFRKSPRAFCESMTSVVGEEPLRAYRPWKWRAGYVYYAGREIPRLLSPGELSEYWAGPGPRFVLVEGGKRDEFLGVVGPVRPILVRTLEAGGAELYSNEEAPRSRTTPAASPDQ